MRHTGYVFLLLMAMLLACGGAQSAPRPLDGARVHLLGSSPALPVSADNDFAAVTGDYACTFDTYEVQIVCAVRGGEDVARFGREGGGPGELGNIGWLVSGPGETAAFVDIRNQRISLFSPGGYVGQLPLPGGLAVAADLPDDSTFTGHRYPASAGPPVLTVVNVSPHRGSVNWEVHLEFDPQELGSSGRVHLAAATRLRSGRFVARLASSGHSALALYGKTGEYIGLLRFPHRPTRYPSDSDIEAVVAEYRRGFGMPPSAVELRELRSRPLDITPRGSLHRLVQEDGRGWLWVLTTSRTAAGTEIDVFDGTGYRGSVTLPDHVLGIQITGDTLLVLTEAEGPDRSIPTRRLDRYEIVR